MNLTLRGGKRRLPDSTPPRPKLGGEAVKSSKYRYLHHPSRVEWADFCCVLDMDWMSFSWLQLGGDTFQETTPTGSSSLFFFPFSHNR